MKVQIIARLVAIVLLFGCYQVAASDHADPIFHTHAEQSLTGLFVFPHRDNLIVILNFYPGLTDDPPLEGVHKMSYQVHFDLTTPLSFDDEQQKLRYGGTVDRPSAIHSTTSIEYRVNDNITLAEFNTTGLLEDAKIQTYVGIRDDPFIFPKFFGTNVVALVAAIPLSAFPDEQTDFIIWGGAYENGKKIDHVGRSNRTMQPRLDFLNTLEPKDHLREINKRLDKPSIIQRILASKLAPLFAIRDYDRFPDVMIYSSRFPVGFPNGRRLTDDVAAITCQTGDCLLWELSFADSKTWQWPRKTTNDKPFLDDFPFLAEPW